MLKCESKLNLLEKILRLVAPYEKNTIKANKMLKSVSIKGTHAQNFQSLFLNFFLHLSITNRYYSQHFQNLLKICPDIQNFRSLPVSAENAKNS
jgi:hypothetical protein